MYPYMYIIKTQNYPYYLGNEIINFKDIIVITNYVEIKNKKLII